MRQQFKNNDNKRVFFYGSYYLKTVYLSCLNALDKVSVYPQELWKSLKAPVFGSLSYYAFLFLCFPSWFGYCNNLIPSYENLC